MTDRRILQQQIEQEPILPGLEQNIARLKEIAGGSSDLMINPITVSGVQIALVTAEAMLSTSMVAELIFDPLNRLDLGEITSAGLFSYLENDVCSLLTARRSTPTGCSFAQLTQALR